MRAVVSLLLRQYKKNKVSKEELEEAVERGIISKEELDLILKEE